MTVETENRLTKKTLHRLSRNASEFCLGLDALACAPQHVFGRSFGIKVRRAGDIAIALQRRNQPRGGRQGRELGRSDAPVLRAPKKCAGVLSGAAIASHAPGRWRTNVASSAQSNLSRTTACPLYPQRQPVPPGAAATVRSTISDSPRQGTPPRASCDPTATGTTWHHLAPPGTTWHHLAPPNPT
eukprot:1176929-Prorocentrum_minimum.AAC.1